MPYFIELFLYFPWVGIFFFRLHILSHFYKMLEWPTRPGRSFARPSSDGSSFSGSHQSTWANKNMGWSGSGRGVWRSLDLVQRLLAVSASDWSSGNFCWLRGYFRTRLASFFAQSIPDFSWESVLPTFKISYGHQHSSNPHCLWCATQQN